MEEKKNTQEKKKMSYDELQKAASDLYRQNRQLSVQMQQMQAALNEAEFNRMTFLVSMLFKVVENSGSFKSDFVVWCTEILEDTLTGFVSDKTQEEDKNSEKNEA